MSNKSRILFALHMPPPVHGAAMVGKYIADSHIVNSRFDCKFINIATATDLEDIGKLSIRKLTDVFALIKRLKSTIAEFHPDLIYYTPNASGMAFYKDWLVVNELKNTGCKIVVHFHNKGVASHQSCIINRLLYKSFFRNLKVILLADNLYEDVKTFVNRSDVQICENGIPDTKIDFSHARAEDKSKAIHLLYLSNMMREKGVYELLEACADLVRRKVKFHCDFVGGWKDITETDFSNRVSLLGLNEYITAHGAKYGQDKESYFNKAEAMVFPTYYHNECFPLVLLEGMMHGIACISTTEAGIPGIIQEGRTGIMVNRESSTELADAIQSLYADRSLCYSMGEAGRKRYEENFTLKAFEHRFVKCLERIIFDSSN